MKVDNITQYIDPIQLYAALSPDKKLILHSISEFKKDCFKYSDNVIKIGLQLNIPRQFKCRPTNISRKVLVNQCWAVLYKSDIDAGRYIPVSGSITLTANNSRKTIQHFTYNLHKVVKGSIILLTQPQHLNIE